MKISQGKKEQGIEVGNHYDKYASKNPIAQFLMAGFSRSLDNLVKKTGQVKLHEIGCGEGYWTLRWLAQGLEAKGCDFSGIAIDLAKQNAEQSQQNPELFLQKSIYELTQDDESPLVICCEVLEHLDNPDFALLKLASIAKPWIILSVPREPIWSILNMLRGKYWKDFGNTPGHIQRWSRREFVSMVERHFDIVEIKTPLPWTMLLCRVRD